MNQDKIVSARYFVKGEPRTITIMAAEPEWERVVLATRHEKHPRTVLAQEPPDILTIGPDYSIRIPHRIARRLGWKSGTKLWIDVEDEQLRQAILGTKFRGAEAKEALEELRRMALERPSTD